MEGIATMAKESSRIYPKHLPLKGDFLVHGDSWRLFQNESTHIFSSLVSSLILARTNGDFPGADFFKFFISIPPTILARH